MFDRALTEQDGGERVDEPAADRATRRSVPRAVPVSARAAWESFAREHGHDVRRCVTRAMRSVGLRSDAAEVDELVQEVYCKVLTGASTCDVPSWPAPQLWSYLNRIARSVAIDAIRSRHAIKRGGEPTSDAEHIAHLRHADQRAASSDLEQRLIDRERSAAIRRRVLELGGTQQGERNLRVLELAAIEGCTAREISRRLSGALTPSSVHTVLYRLRRQLVAEAAAELAG
jgi:RNA polymerase sigma factor (sigma-70 family)